MLANTETPVKLLDERTSRRLTWIFAALLLTGCIVGIVVPAGLGWDFANFYDAGRRAAAGQITDLYDSTRAIGGEAPQGKMGFWGTPISALLYAPLSWLSAEAALVAFKIENVFALIASFGVLFGSCRRVVPNSAAARWQFAAVFSFLCLIYQPFWTVFRVGGQTTATVFLLLTVALLFHTNGRFWTSASCVVLATLIKPVLAPVLLCLLCVSGMDFVRKTAMTLGVAGLVSVAWLGWPVHLAFLVRVQHGAQAIYPWPFNSSLYIFLDNLRRALASSGDPGSHQWLFGVLTNVLRGAVVGTVVYLVVRSRRAPLPTAARRHFEFLLAVTFFLLWSLTLWEHYLAFLFLLLIYVVAAHRHFSRQALILVGGIFVLSLGQNLIWIAWLQAHVRFQSSFALIGIGLFKSGPLILTLIFLWRHSGEWLGSYAVPAWTHRT